MPTLSYLVLRLSLVLVLCFVVSGCGGDDAPPERSPTTLDYELFETTRELDGDTLEAIGSIAEDMTSIRFTRRTALIDDLDADDVLLSGATATTPNGLLVQIVSVESSAGEVVVRTKPATVFHAFRRLNVRLDRLAVGADPRPLPSAAPPPPASAVGTTSEALSIPLPLGSPSFDEPLFDGDNLPTLEDRVDAKGKMTETVTVTFWLSFDWQNLSPTQAFSALDNLLDDLGDLFSGDPPDLGDILHLDTGLRIDGVADVLLDVTGSSSLHFDETFNLSTLVLAPIPVGPLVFVPSVTLDARFQGGVAGQLELDYGLGANFGLGFGYADGDLDPYVSGPTVTAIEPTAMVTATADLRTELELRLNLQLYGFFGPYASIVGYGALEIDRHQSPCWRMTGGLEGRVGASIGLLGRSLKNIDGPHFGLGDPIELGSGPCEPPPDPPPTDDMITPWSKSYSGTHWTTGTDESFTNIELSHDGRLLVTSESAKTVLKLDQGGALTWARSFSQPASSPIEPQHAVPMLDTGILVATDESLLIKLDQGGSLEWATAIESANADSGWWKMKRRGDEIWLGGRYQPQKEVLSYDAWFVRLAADGGVLSSWTWGTEQIETVRDILPLDDGALLVGHARDFSTGSARGIVLRLETDGTIRWAKHIDDCYGEDLVLSTAIRTMDGSFVIGGWFYATHTDTVLFRLSADGTESTPAWATRTGVPQHLLGPEIRSIHQLPTGELRVVGRYAEPSDDHVFVAGTDSIGRFAWLRRYGAEGGRSTPPASFITDRGGLLVAAGSAALSPYPGGFWAFEVPTPNALIDFSPASGSTTTTLETKSESACMNITTAPTTTQTVPLVQRLVDVSAESVTTDVQLQ